MEAYIIQVAIAVVSGGLGAGLTAWATRKGSLDQKMMDYINTIEKREKELIEKVEKVEKQFKALQGKYDLLEAINLNLPNEMCVIDQTGTMVMLNKKYAKRYIEPLGKSIDDVRGLHLIEIFGADKAFEYMKNFEPVFDNGEVWCFAESYFTDEDMSNEKYQEFQKHPIELGGNVVFGGLLGLKPLTEEEYNTYKPKRLQ
jgi:transcriptional regulator with PAS, ATPase and Fis domain